MSARRDSADGPEDIDAAFAEIVAELEQDPRLAQWPDERGPEPADPADADSGAGGASSPPAAPRPIEPGPVESSPVEPGPIERGPVERGPIEPTGRVDRADTPSGPRDWTPDEEDEGHFVPPEPPPLPKPRASTIGGISLVLVGVLLLAPGLTGAASTVSLPLGLVAISGGIGWLLFRMRQTPPASEDDDGAQL